MFCVRLDSFYSCGEQSTTSSYERLFDLARDPRVSLPTTCASLFLKTVKSHQPCSEEQLAADDFPGLDDLVNNTALLSSDISGALKRWTTSPYYTVLVIDQFLTR
jgi:hypothetical protein